MKSKVKFAKWYYVFFPSAWIYRARMIKFTELMDEHAGDLIDKAMKSFAKTGKQPNFALLEKKIRRRLALAGIDVDEWRP